MSGLEPIAALGLVCNILQLVELGKKTIDRIKTVYQDGKPDNELEQGAAVLEELAKDVKKASHLSPRRKKYETLSRSAADCATAASDLSEELRFLVGNAKKGSLVSALKVTSRVAWRQRRLERLKRNLDAVEQRMQTSLLAQVWSSTNAASIELSGVRQELRFFIEQYRQGRRKTTELVSAESLNTRKHVSVEAERTREAVGSVSQKVDRLVALEDAQIDERVRERFLESLKYPGFNQRRNQIGAAYGDTLGWIFVGDNNEELNDDSGSDEYVDSDGDYGPNSDASGEYDGERQFDQDHHSDHNNDADEQHGFRDEVNTGASGSDGEASWNTVSDSEFTDSDEEAYRNHDAFSKIKWDSFSNWLSSTDVIYWISGKPGSGKTTVVKYILADERTKKYLDIWSPGCAIVSHYFWLPGSPMQRNMEGLLCSLLYQLLEKNSNALVEVMSSISGSKSSHTDWSNAELHSAVLRALDSYKNGVCFFLDGIDEIKPEDETKDGIPEFLDWAIELTQRSKIKLCLASRPDPNILETRLSEYPRLRLQDLNYQDLITYAEGRVKIPEKDISGQHEDLVGYLADKAEGVFLWLVLAIKSVNEGFRNNDSVEILHKRIDRLPQGLDSLYKDMWARAGAGDPREYRQTAALYFKLIFAGEHVRCGTYTLDVILATTSLADRVLHALADPSKLVREDDMLQQCIEVKKNLKIYCLGLVEMVSDPRREFDMESAADCSWYGHVYEGTLLIAAKTRLEFIHRTARDFLTDTELGREILGFDTSSEFSIECQLLYGRLASLALFAQWDSHENVWAYYLEKGIVSRWQHTDRELWQNWNRLVSVCEQLADSGRLLSDSGSSRDDDLRYRCSGTHFLNAIARCDTVDKSGLLISRIKNRCLSEDEKSSFLMASLTDIEDYIQYGIQSIFCTCHEILSAGADPNWQGWYQWSDFPTHKSWPYGLLQTPWQTVLVDSLKCLLRPSRDDSGPFDRILPPTELNLLAELVFLFISEGAKLGDPVHIPFSFTSSTHRLHLGLPWWKGAYIDTVLTSIPAYIVVKLLTKTLRNSCSTLDTGPIPKVCNDLENACESYRSGGTCRVFGKSEGKGDTPRKYLTWWETTNDMQNQLGGKLMELLEGQVLLSAPVIEAADGSEARINAEPFYQHIWDNESWALYIEEEDRSNIFERLVELGVMLRLDGVIEIHTTKEWVQKHNQEIRQYGGTT